MYADSARANFFRTGGDHLTLLSVYNEVRMSVGHLSTTRRADFLYILWICEIRLGCMGENEAVM